VYAPVGSLIFAMPQESTLFLLVSALECEWAVRPMLREPAPRSAWRSSDGVRHERCSVRLCYRRLDW